MSEEAVQGAEYIDYATEAESGHLELARPWPRYWAKKFDVVANIVIVGFAAGAIFPEITYMEVFQGQFGDYLLTLLFLPVAMVLDAAIMSYWGTTLGKKIAGLSVVAEPGVDRSMERMLRRNLGCYVKGMALGIPFASLFTCIHSYNTVEREGTSSWDDSSQTKVVSVPNDGGRTILIAFCCISLAVAASLLNVTA